MAATYTATDRDVEKFLLRPLADHEAAYVHGLLQTAWLRLILADPTIPGRVETGRLPQELVDDTVAEMVANVLRNPTGARSRTVTKNSSLSIDDYSEQTQSSTQETIDRALAEGTLYPTESQLRLLRERTSGAFTIRPGV